MPHMSGLIGEGLAEYRIGQTAGAKGLPEGFTRFFGHYILAVVARHQHHDMAGTLSAFVTAMDFTWRVLVVRVAHTGAREEREALIIFLSTWLSISPCQRSEQAHICAAAGLLSQLRPTPASVDWG
jgi:hypothetical protein